MIEEHVAKTGSPKGKAVLAKLERVSAQVLAARAPSEMNTPEASDAVVEEATASSVRGEKEAHGKKRTHARAVKRGYMSSADSSELTLWTFC